MKFYFCDVPHNIGRKCFCVHQSLLAVVWHRPVSEGWLNPESRASASCDADLDAARIERKRNSGGSWHVSRLSVFTEIPCTLRPITFVTDYSTKVSHRARGWETYPDKLHRANRQCSQMEPEAGARLFKQRASRACGSHDHAQTSKSVTLNFLPLERRTDLIEYATRAKRWALKCTT